MTPRKIWKGHSYPLGATWMGHGVNFALYSEHATGVELCLFDEQDTSTEAGRIKIEERDDHVWHIFLPEIRPGQLYGYRVDGPWEPAKGHRFNRHKLVLDPYAKAIAGEVKWGDEMYSYKMGGPDGDLTLDDRDNAQQMPKCVVIDSAFTWGDRDRPNRPLHDTVIYEVHVKGFSKLWEAVPSKIRGSYAGIGSPQAIEYFQKLGVTAIELLPVHQHIAGSYLLEKKLTDYWGYNTIGFFAPESTYSAAGDQGQQVQEFKAMVNSLHSAGLEVILDVVYNHTAEGNQNGPNLCFRGIDNSSYYRLVADNPRYYNDYTGTGNTLNVPHPRVLQLLMDSLRYWVTEMHVDGFRFDLASTLARELHEVSKLSSFFDVIHQDPIISQVKLIAEPWDVGEGGYQVGNFPVLWAEWNGRYRDTVRRFWKGDAGVTSDFAYRLCGSSDLYAFSGKTPNASINFVTSHDGFTLRDLVSFSEKHNQANGEDNKDGDNNNASWNWGHEGLDAPPEVLQTRQRMQRGFLATLILSQGVPMLRGGDEYGVTQQGNNNAYCQDNEISWLNWKRTPEEEGLSEYTSKLIHFRQAHPIFHQPRFFLGRDIRGMGVKDITWFDGQGAEMNDQAWNSAFARTFGVMLAGDSLSVKDYFGNAIKDDTFLMYFNAHHQDVEIRLPGEENHVRWRHLFDSGNASGFLDSGAIVNGGGKHKLTDRSVVIFQQAEGSDEQARYRYESP